MKSFEIYISQRLDLIYFLDFLSEKIFLFCNFNKVSIYLTVLTCRWLSVHLKTLHQWSQTWSGWAWMTCFVLLNLLLLIKHLNLSDWLESLLKAKNMLRMSTFCCLQFETSAAISDIAGFFFMFWVACFYQKNLWSCCTDMWFLCRNSDFFGWEAMFIIRCCVRWLDFSVLVKESLKAVLWNIFCAVFFSALKVFAYVHVFTGRLGFHF